MRDGRDDKARDYRDTGFANLVHYTPGSRFTANNGCRNSCFSVGISNRKKREVKHINLVVAYSTGHAYLFESFVSI